MAGGGKGAGPGPVKIVTAKQACHVQRFAHKPETGNKRALHGFWIDMSQTDAARGGFGPGKTGKGGRYDSPPLYGGGNPPPVGT